MSVVPAPAPPADPFAGINPALLPPVPAALFEAARTRFLLRPAVERRKSSRYFVAIPAVAVPLATDGAVAAEPFRGVIADLSDGGLRILHMAPLGTPLLAVRLELWNDALSAVIRVGRCVRVGPHYESAGPFAPAPEPTGTAEWLAALLD